MRKQCDVGSEGEKENLTTGVTKSPSLHPQPGPLEAPWTVRKPHGMAGASVGTRDPQKTGRGEKLVPGMGSKAPEPVTKQRLCRRSERRGEDDHELHA